MPLPQLTRSRGARSMSWSVSTSRRRDVSSPQAHGLYARDLCEPGLCQTQRRARRRRGAETPSADRLCRGACAPLPRSTTRANSMAARRRASSSASAVTQLEALRAGVGLGVIHDFIARRFKDLVPVLPERRAERSLLARHPRGHAWARPHPRRRRTSREIRGARPWDVYVRRVPISRRIRRPFGRPMRGEG